MTGSTEVNDEGAARRERLAALVGGAVLALSLIVRAAWWFRRAYNHDDFYFAYFSWIRSTGAVPGRDFWLPNFSPLVELWTPVARLGHDSFFALDAARALILVVSLLLLFAVYRLVLALGGSLPWALAIVAVVSWEPSFTQRIGDVRGDPVAALFLISAASLVVSSRNGRVLIGAAFLAGCAVVFATKLVYVLPFVLAGVALAKRERRLLRVVEAGLAACAVPAAYLVWRAVADGFAVLVGVLHDIRAGVGLAGDPTGTASAALGRDAVFWLAILAAAVIALARGTRGERDRFFWYAVVTTGFLVAFLAANPFLYPYNFVILVPLAAPLLLAFRTPRHKGLIAAIVSIAALLNGLAAARAMLRQPNFEQRRLIEWVWSATATGEAVFDWQGMHFGRPGVRHWWIYGAIAPQYLRGNWYSLADEWTERRVTLMIPNYRFRWLNPADRAFLDRHYVFVAPCLLAPGVAFTPADFRGGPTAIFDVSVAGDYRLEAAGPAASIDGVPVSGSAHLERGLHRLTFSSAPPGRAFLVFTTPRREAAGPPPCPEGPLLYGF